MKKIIYIIKLSCATFAVFLAWIFFMLTFTEMGQGFFRYHSLDTLTNINKIETAFLAYKMKHGEYPLNNIEKMHPYFDPKFIKNKINKNYNRVKWSF